MDDIASTSNVWTGLLTVALAYIGYTAKKRDDDVTKNTNDVSRLELVMERNKTFNAETYATKPTMIAMFQTATEQTKDAVASVIKSVDATNIALSKTNDKIDGVKDSIKDMQNNIMSELIKKT